ncbi:MAG TPA: hypothetical protein VHZ95_19380 [Polyangiales bacterium]|nr:hypothetical protein [Polyangiales bacterium]
MGLTGGSAGEKLKKPIAKVLGHGEFLVASAEFTRGAEPRSAILAGQSLPDNLVLAVTDRRMLVFRLGGLPERVREVTHALPLRSITEVRAEPSGKTLRITVLFGDGATAAFDASRAHASDAGEVARALTTALARR